MKIVEDVKTELVNILKEDYNKILVLGIIDDQGLDFIYNQLDDNVNILIFVDRKYTTKSMLERLNILKNVYYIDNNDCINIDQSNLIILENKDEVKVLIIQDFKKYTLDNSLSTAFYICVDREQLEELLKKYNINDNKKYIKLNSSEIQKLEEENKLRNSKASTLDKELDLDEIKMSFRRINEIENKDEFINKVKSQSNINANKDDIIIQNIDSQFESKNSSDENKLDFEIEIDLGE